MSQSGSYSQRSRSGCLTCRRKRKKCDEQRPFCSRCTRTNSRCIWPEQSESDASPRSNDSASYDVNPDHISLSFPHSYGYPKIASYPSETVANQHSVQQSVDLLNGLRVHGDSDFDMLEPNTRSLGLRSDTGVALNLTKPFLPSWSTLPQSAPARPSDDNSGDFTSCGLTHNRAMGTRIWEYAQDFGPRIVWPNRTTDDIDDFDPEGVMPLIRRSVATLRMSEEPNFQEMLNFYSIYLARYLSDYASVCDVLFSRVRRRFAASDSLKHGMMGTALLFRANYEISPLTGSLRDRSKEQYQLAIRALRLELESNYLSPRVKIAGLVEIMNYEYIAGYLSAYYQHLDQAAALVRVVMGREAIDFTNLSGEQTFDIRCIAWFDILSSMALARPTLLDYKVDTRDLSSLSRWDRMFDSDHGVEWIFGCPDALLVLVARISTLRHARISHEERITRGVEIEQLARNIQFRPVRAKSPAFRVARLAMQEVCRHAAILYIYHAIFKSDSSHPIVRDSVKTVIKLASILKPGFNPDCFIPVPYFIAGTFAKSERDRLILRNRVLSCGNERYLRYLAARLDDLWKETDATGRLANWSGTQPPTFAF
ncbi:unnamed protein product [Rhizoctonia solani]|uniref:Zn(2)-C6 fungal-type domain-containing protein n=1 Tax=Rhizoctonia solani TaxID=456999 RepID=A0A8H3BYH4_9AGAM|nr:unnamed protein product [Rhizoctonia solani]